MALIQWGVLPLLVILCISQPCFSSSPSIIRIKPEKDALLTTDGRRRGVDLYCEAWKFTVETNDAGVWTRVPQMCVNFVEEYITGERYVSDSQAVADSALAHAHSVRLSGAAKHAWVFDIDETLLSNVPYYAVQGFGSDIFDEPSFDVWVDLAKAPALSPSLRLYNKLKELGFTIFLLTGRCEYQRNATERNLLYAGYSGWERLILRGDSDQGTLASVYKSEKRKEIEDEGYIIHGNSGDQWSDLMGYAVAKRSFKLPNPLYYIS
ncbi:hypothetical protein ACS0TY_021597 [Phlomoides rotata]